MNKSNLLGLLFFALCFVHQGYAQIENYCEYNTNAVKKYLPYLDLVSNEFKQDMIEKLSSCAENGNSESAYISALLTIGSDPTTAQEKIAFDTILLAARNGNVDAMFNVAYMFKEGQGTLIDLEQAFYWYSKASEGGKKEADYAVGYFQLKGLGSTTQSYANALQSFSAKYERMSSHWEGICHYFGYGVPVNIPLAKEIWADGGASNSVTLENYLDHPNSYVYSTVSDRDQNLLDRQNEDLQYLTQEELHYVYEGKFIEYDWSKEIPKRVVVFKLTLENNNVGELYYKLELQSEVYTGIATYQNNTLIFDKGILSFPLQRLYKDSDLHKITYQLSSIKLNRVNITSDNNFFAGDVKGNITDWKEPIPPTKIILESIHRPGELPPPILKDIVASPNPVAFQLRVRFTVTKPNTKVQVGFIGAPGNPQFYDVGTHTIICHVYPYAPGPYILRVYANDQLEHKQTIIKKRFDTLPR